MPDDPNAGTGAQGGNNGGGAGGNTPPPTGSNNTPPGQDPGNTGGGSEGGGKTYDEAYVKKIRDEAAANRVKAKELEDRLKAIEDKDLSETQKLQKQLQQIEKEREEERRKAAEADAKLRQAEILTAVTTAGAKKPAIVAKLVDAEATDLAKAIAALKKDNPELFQGSGSADGGAGSRGSQGAANNGATLNEAMNQQIRRLAGRG